MRHALVILALLATGRDGHADDRVRIAAARALLAAQAKALAAHDEAALISTFAPEPVVSYGGEPTEGKLEEGSLDAAWSDAPPRKVVLGATQIGWSGAWGWISAEATITVRGREPGAKARTAPYHWTALLVAEGDGVKTKALSVAEAVAERQLDAADYVNALAELDHPGPLTAMLGKPGALVANLAPDRAASVFGSSPGDRGLGQAAAKQLLTRWRKLSLVPVTREPTGGPLVEQTVGDVRFAFATVKMVPALVALSAFAIARKRGDGWEVVAVQYGAIDIKR